MGSMDLALVLAEFSPIVLATLDGRLMVPLGTIDLVLRPIIGTQSGWSRCM